MLGKTSSSRNVSKMGTVSLLSSFSEPKANWADDREIVVESAWPEWRGFGGIRASLRKGPYFYLFDENDQVYNTLTDTLEARALPLGEAGTSRLRDDFSAYLRSDGYAPWKAANRADLDRTLFGEELWRDRPITDELATELRTLALRYKDNAELRGWRANIDLQRADWNDLKAIAGKDRPIWTYVADMNLNTPKALPPLDPCQRALFTHTGERNKDCGDDLSRALATWADESKPRKERDAAMETYNKLEVTKALNDRVSRTNLMVGDVWDVPRSRWSEPALTDLILAMPDMKKYRASRVRAAR
jgi:hypothetical protein